MKKSNQEIRLETILMSTKEIIQTLISPTEKLIDNISAAIGKIYEPKYVKKMAEAKADEIKTISEAVRNNRDIPIVYNSTSFTIDNRNNEEITKRASKRLASQGFS